MSNIDKIIESLEDALKKIQQRKNSIDSKEIDRDRGVNSKSQDEYEKYLDDLANQINNAILILKNKFEEKENKPIRKYNIQRKPRF